MRAPFSTASPPGGGLADSPLKSAAVPRQPAVETDVLRLGHYDWVGFDIDHTLVRYRPETFEPALAGYMLKYLVQEHGYPASVREHRYDGALALRGLVIEKATGNLLLLDENRRIMQARHGAAVVPHDDGPLEYFGVATAQYLPLNTFFDRLIGPLYSFLVDQMDAALEAGDDAAARMVGLDPSVCEGWTRQRFYVRILEDLLRAHRFNLSTLSGTGWFLNDMRENREKYLEHRPGLRAWLRRFLARSTTKLFVVSNADFNHSDAMLSYTFGYDWRSLFSVVVFEAKKPVFFTGNSPFLSLRNGTRCEVDGPGLYRCGSAAELERYFKTPSVLFFGDHILYDVVSPTHARGWHTVAIADEIGPSWEPSSWHPNFIGTETKTFQGSLLADYPRLVLFSLRQLEGLDPSAAAVPLETIDGDEDATNFEGRVVVHSRVLPAGMARSRLPSCRVS